MDIEIIVTLCLATTVLGILTLILLIEAWALQKRRKEAKHD